MPITAQSIIRRAAEALQDDPCTRWPADELVRYLNDGQREIALQRPDAVARRATITCVPGPVQSLPADGIKLLQAVSNTASRRALRLVDEALLDAQVPAWRAMPAATDLVHYMYDPREPRVFTVYPPATATAQLNVVYARLPAPVGEPTPFSNWTAVAGDIDVPDIFAGALLDYVLSRAWGKDAEFGGNAALSQAHFQKFTAALGVEVQGTAAVAPGA